MTLICFLCNLRTQLTIALQLHTLQYNFDGVHSVLSTVANIVLAFITLLTILVVFDYDLNDVFLSSSASR